MTRARGHFSRILPVRYSRADLWLGDRGYDADWFKDALENKRIKACMLGRKTRKKPVKYHKPKYKRRHKIEIMCGRLKDWRRGATRYDRCQKHLPISNSPRRKRYMIIMSPEVKLLRAIT